MKVKAIIIFISITLFFSFAVQAQTQEIRNLVRLARVWGFLKYYHPAVAKGNMDWDSELVDMISKVRQLDKPGFAKAMNSWYQTLPAAGLDRQHSSLKGDSVIHVFNVSEIGKMGLDNKLMHEFRNLYFFHKPDSSRFITDRYKGYQLDYTLPREAELKFPEKEASRLVALFRYWTVINYFHPHKHTMKESWDGVLERFVPVFLKADRSDTYKRAVQQLCAAMGDSHSFYNEPDHDKNAALLPPFNLTKIKGRYVIESLYRNPITAAEDYRLGDEVISVNGRSVKEIEKQLIQITPASNGASLARELAINMLKADTLKHLEVVFRRGKQQFMKTVERRTFAQLVKDIRVFDPMWKRIDDDTWYVNAAAIQRTDTLKTLFRELQSANTLILDMRRYPNYNVINALMDRLFSAPVKLGNHLNGLVLHPGVFVKRADIFTPAKSAGYFGGQVIVLVNEYTQSLGESISAQLRQRPNTLIVGSQTAGTTGNVVPLTLPGDILVRYTGVGFEGTAGSFTQRRGVKLDVKVKCTIRGISEGRDEILTKAKSFKRKAESKLKVQS